MYFDGYDNHAVSTINPSLLWEYDLSEFDYVAMRNVVVQRVIERGWPNDWYAILNMYGLEGVKEVVKIIPYLNDKDMNFVSVVFDIPFNEMQCFKNKQSNQGHWTS